jgi:anti-sigma factor RsiW
VKRFSCEELVEFVTVYLDGAFDEATGRSFEDHLRLCEGCARYLGQYRATIGALGELPPERLSETARDRLLGAFRDSRHS